MVSVIAFNSSSDVLYDYVALMDLAAIEALVDAIPGNPIPEQDLLGALPGSLPGWTYLSWGSISQSNETYSTALGLYSKGTMLAIEEMVYLAIASQVVPYRSFGLPMWAAPWMVGGFDSDFDPTTIEIIGTDEGYPKKVNIQGYSGVEWRSSGDNLGQITQFQGDLESFGALWVDLGDTVQVPEVGPFFLAMSLFVFLKRSSRLFRLLWINGGILLRITFRASQTLRDRDPRDRLCHVLGLGEMLAPGVS